MNAENKKITQFFNTSRLDLFYQNPWLILIPLECLGAVSEKYHIFEFDISTRDGKKILKIYLRLYSDPSQRLPYPDLKYDQRKYQPGN